MSHIHGASQGGSRDLTAISVLNPKWQRSLVNNGKHTKSHHGTQRVTMVAL